MIKLIHNRKILFIILILIIILSGVIFAIRNNYKDSIGVNKSECLIYSDCVPSSCCHANSCTNIKNKPDCFNTLCTMDCESLLDCGSGKCLCINNKCEAVAIKN